MDYFPSVWMRVYTSHWGAGRHLPRLSATAGAGVYSMTNYWSGRMTLKEFLDGPAPNRKLASLNTLILVWTSWLNFVVIYELGQQNIEFTARQLREAVRTKAASLQCPLTHALFKSKHFSSPGNSCRYLALAGALEYVGRKPHKTYRLNKFLRDMNLREAVYALSKQEEIQWRPGTDRANRTKTERKALQLS